MKITKCEGLKRADEVVRELRKIKAPYLDGNECSISAYKNGREDGYAVYFSAKRLTRAGREYVNVWFGENRNTDGIVVYVDDSRRPDFDFPRFFDGKKGDNVYAERQVFHPDEAAKAAKYIMKRVRKALA